MDVNFLIAADADLVKCATAARQMWFDNFEGTDTFVIGTTFLQSFIPPKIHGAAAQMVFYCIMTIANDKAIIPKTPPPIDKKMIN